MSFRDKLLKLRSESKLSQQELADLIGVSRQTVSRWEAGKSVPSSNQIANICKAFHIQANDLVETEGEFSDNAEQEHTDPSLAESSREKKLSTPLIVLIGVFLLIAVIGLIVTIIYAVKDATYDTSSTVWIAAIPQNTPFVVLSVFIAVFIILLAVLLIYLLRSRKK